MTPKRVQQRRDETWQDRENPAVVVSRASKRWGNPFRLNNGYDVQLRDGSHAEIDADTRQHAVDAYRLWLGGNIRYMDTVPPSHEEIRRELAGRNLACWCPLDQPCHADVLLGIANA